MALPTIPTCFRITTNFAQVDGVQPANVWHVQAPTSDVTEVGAAIIAEEVPGLYLPVHEDFEPTSYSVLPLDGTSAAVEFPRTGTLDSLCLGDGEWAPEAAAVLKMRTGHRGPRGRGRLFIGPLCEAAMDNGLVTGDTTTLLVPAWTEYRDQLDALDIHISVASYVHADANAVTSFAFDNHIGTQRRRLLQQR